MARGKRWSKPANPHHPSAEVCHRKVRYRDKAEAQHALRTLHQRVGRTNVPHRAYHCNCCNGWHLSSRDDRG